MLANTSDYFTLLEQIKAEISTTRTRAVTHVNSELICMYWRVGKMLGKGSWGDKVIDTLSKDVRAAYPGIKGFSPRYLKYMKRFAYENEFEIVQTVFA